MNGQGTRRVERVQTEVKEAIAQFLLRGFGPGLKGLVTITRVIMPADLRSAKVYFSEFALGEKDDFSNIERLESRVRDIQSHIASTLKLKFCPRLTFFRDDSLDEVLKVEKILKNLEDERAPSKGKDDSED